jgi:hypothetical protein
MRRQRIGKARGHRRIGKAKRRANGWCGMFLALVPERTARAGRADA